MNFLDTHLLKVKYADDLGTLTFKFRIITTCSNRGIKLPVSCIRCITLNDSLQRYKQMGDGIRTTRIFYVTYTPPSSANSNRGPPFPLYSIHKICQYLLQIALPLGSKKCRLESCNLENPKFQGTSKSRTKFLEAWKKLLTGKLADIALHIQ